MIPLHRPYISDKTISFIEEAIQEGKLSGNGRFTYQCQDFFEKRYNFKKCLLTNSCTSALEMAALLIDIQPGDEVIVPSFSYVSSVNPFVMQGAKIVFSDSEVATPNLDIAKLSSLITSRTKAIVVVHYAGISCDMDAIMDLANEHDIFVIEDAAHSQGSYWKDKPLGGIGHLGAFSFHATKNLTSGQGGLLIINSDKFIDRAEVLWEKGTNRKEFIRGDVDKYEWCDIGSSFYPSEITAAFLWAQIQSIDELAKKREEQWSYYAENLKDVSGIETPKISDNANHNAHLFYAKILSKKLRDELIQVLNNKKIGATFHYLALHQSPFWKGNKVEGLENAEVWENQIIRLPLYYDLSIEEQDFIIETIKQALN